MYASTKPHSFNQGAQVLVRDYRDKGHKWVPGVVQYENGPVTYGVEVNGATWKRHVDQLRQRGSNMLEEQTVGDENPDQGQDLVDTGSGDEKAKDQRVTSVPFDEGSKVLRQSSQVSVRPRRLIEEI